MREIFTNKYFVVSVMAIVIFFATQLLKMPIKYFTAKLENPQVRRMVNLTILLIPFALGVVFDILYSTYVTHTAFSIIVGLGYGSAGISLYATIERFFKVKIPNPYTETEEGKAIAELAEKVTADKKIDKNDADPVKEFWKKVK